MKTIKQAQTDLATLNKECSECIRNNRFAEAKRKEKKADAIRECILYLEKEPREIFVQQEVERLEKMIKNREEAVEKKIHWKSL